MQLLSDIIIKRPGQAAAVIQLLQGDLSAIPKEYAADILIISAYPGSYIPVPKTLIAALDSKGLSVEALARHKAVDLRDQLGCWLSAPLNPEQQALFNFKKILCFEPWHQSTDQSAVIGNIFRCINTVAFSENNNIIAMPVLASGKQKVPFEKMLPAMLDASIFWLESGLPLTGIKLVVFSDEQAELALPVFTRAKEQNELKQSVRDGIITGTDALKMLELKKREGLPGEETMLIVTSEIKEMAQQEMQRDKTAPQVGASKENSPQPEVSTIVLQRPAFAGAPAVMPLTPPSFPAAPEEGKAPGTDASQPSATTAADAGSHYDYFISYSHSHAEIVEAFVNNLVSADKQLKIFFDKNSIPPGGIWIKQLSDAIQKAKKVLIFLSPEYSNSPVCWDEFQCAKLMEYNSKKQLIQTVYLYNDAALPPIMGIYSWADGREADIEKLKTIAEQLIAER